MPGIALGRSEIVEKTRWVKPLKRHIHLPDDCATGPEISSFDHLGIPGYCQGRRVLVDIAERQRQAEFSYPALAESAPAPIGDTHEIENALRRRETRAHFGNERVKLRGGPCAHRSLVERQVVSCDAFRCLWR
ncbi:hypothetical protein ACVWXL_006096 [Bradyrhizobium sp. GM22.5]